MKKKSLTEDSFRNKPKPINNIKPVLSPSSVNTTNEEKIWCTFGSFYPSGYGRITKESSGNALYIKYSESQMYPDEVWENNPLYIKRYDTLEEAAKAYQKSYNAHTYGIITNKQIEEDMRYKFPSYFKEKERSD